MVSPAGSGRSVSDASVGTLGAVRPCDKTCWVEGTLTRAAGDGAVTAPTTCNPCGATSRLAGSRHPAAGNRADFRFGSKAALTEPKYDFRSAPNNGPIMP